MTKIIIVAYNFDQQRTASQRPKSWFRFFKENDIYPIVVTINSNDLPTKEVFSYGEVHRVDSPALYMERNFGNKRSKLINKLFKKFHQLMIAHYAKDATTQSLESYIQSNLIDRADTMIVTGSPFQLFRIGYNFSKIKGKKWIADYRDQWTLNKIPLKGSIFIDRINTRLILSRLELRWVRSASFVVHVSKHMAREVEVFTKVKSYVVENGFFEDEHEVNHVFPDKKEISFVYVGALYSIQRIDQTIDVIHKGLKLSGNRGSITFIGTSLSTQVMQQIEMLDKSILEVRIIDKISKRECLQIQNNCHFGIMLNYGIKGNPSSKLYEFLGMKQMVFNYPSDQDVIEDTLNICNLGFSFFHAQSAIEWVADTSEKISNGTFKKRHGNEQRIKDFSRRSLTHKYSDLIKDNI